MLAHERQYIVDIIEIMSHRQWKVELETLGRFDVIRPFTILSRSIARPLAPARVHLDMVGGREGALSVLVQVLRRPKDVILGRVRITCRGRCDAGAPGKCSNRYSGGGSCIQHITPQAVRYRSTGKMFDQLQRWRLASAVAGRCASWPRPERPAGRRLNRGATRGASWSDNPLILVLGHPTTRRVGVLIPDPSDS
jgi:hypothetical protein